MFRYHKICQVLFVLFPTLAGESTNFFKEFCYLEAFFYLPNYHNLMPLKKHVFFINSHLSWTWQFSFLQWTCLICSIRIGNFSSVTQSCPTLCHLLDCSMLGFPVHPLTPGDCSNSCPLSCWCHPIISSSEVPFSSRLQSFLESGSFPMSQFFVEVTKVLEPQLASVLPWTFRTDSL